MLGLKCLPLSVVYTHCRVYVPQGKWSVPLLPLWSPVCWHVMLSFVVRSQIIDSKCSEGTHSNVRFSSGGQEPPPVRTANWPISKCIHENYK